MKQNEMVSVTIELDKKDKENMEQICGEMGLPLNAAFAVFTKKVVRERRIPFEINAGINIDKEIVRNLIYAVSVYAMESCWTDSDMMDALESMGVTRNDMIACGFGEFVQNYESQQ